MDNAAIAGAFAKARTGGVTPDLFPSPERLLAFLRAAVDEGVRFKATAGLHHPLRGSYPLTHAPDAPRGVMFGYLNVLLATAVLRAGGSDEEGLAALVESDAAAIGFGAEALEWGRFRFDAKELADLRARPPEASTTQDRQDGGFTGAGDRTSHGPAHPWSLGWEMSSVPSSSRTVGRWSGSTATPAYRPAGAVYRPRRPTETPL